MGRWLPAALFVALFWAFTDGALAKPTDGKPTDGKRSRSQPERREVPRPFERGSMNLGLVIGFGAGGGATSFTLGGAFGYFVLPGLEPGLELEVTFGSGRPTLTSLLPYLRWIVWRSYSVSPFLKVQGGRWFISDGHDDLWVFGGGGGLVFFLGRRYGIQLEGVYYHLFPGRTCGDDCSDVRVGLSLGFYFGGPEPLPPPPPQPPREGY